MSDADLEQRLRRALAARAAGVTARHLRPIVAERRGLPLRWWLPLSAGVAAAAVVTLIFFVVHRAPAPGRPVAPAASVPAPAPSASGLPSAGVTSVVPSGSAPVTSGSAVSGPDGSVPDVSPSADPSPSSSVAVSPKSAGSPRVAGPDASPPLPTPGA